MPDRILQAYQGGKLPVKIKTVVEVELLELLGIGAFGTVWKVRDTITGKLYVLKIIQGIKPGCVLVERVRLEAEVSIPSRHIAPVIGLCEWDSSTFLILFEFFPAKSLGKVLYEETLTTKRKSHIFNQILTGVADAHRSNVIHRDLKPENILVGEGNLVKIIDFGLSKFKGKGLTVTGDVMGTPPYMSPELLIYGSKFADARVDIYALGHILYEMSMGCTFWARQGWPGNRFEEFIKFLTQVPKPVECIDISDFKCDFYSNATEVIARMVKTNPEERYTTVQEVLKALSYKDTDVSIPDTWSNFNLKYPLLIVESGTNRDARTLVNIEPGSSLVMGRADIAGNDRSISSRHLVFNRQGDRYLVNDLMSKNGTLLKGVTLDPDAPAAELQNGDRIKVGEVFLRFVLPSKT